MQPQAWYRCSFNIAKLLAGKLDNFVTIILSLIAKYLKVYWQKIKL